MYRRYPIIAFMASIMVFISANSYGINTRHDILPDTVTILGDKFYPPYEQLNDNGQPEGFAIDLIKEVMKRLKIPYTIRLTSRDEMTKEIQFGNVNLYLGMTYTEERSKHVKYGTILDYVFKCAAFRKDREQISSFQQLKGKHVVTEKGTYSQDLLHQAGYKVTAVETFKDAFNMLDEGKCDAVMCNKMTVDYMINEMHYSNLDYYILEFQPEKFCLTGNNDLLLTKINLTIYDLKKEGLYNKLANKWFVKEHKVQSMRIFYLCLGVAILTCLILFIFNSLLRMKVRKAKWRLENESSRLSLSVHAGNITVWGYDVKLKRYFNIYCNYFSPNGDTLEKEMKNYHPDDRQLLEDTLKRACEGHSTKEPIHVRMDRTHSGNWRFIEKEMIPVVDEKDNIIRVVGTHKDVTNEVLKQKQVEDYANKIDYILKSSGIIIWNYDIQTHATIAHISRNNKVEGIELKNIINYVDEADKKNAMDIIQKMDNREIEDCNVRIKFTHTNFSSHEAYLSFHATPIRDKNGIIQSYNGLCLNITDLIETQIQLQKEKEEALKADKLKSAFLANMSHEIRTPLNSIVGFSEMMPYTDDESDRTRFYEIIKNNNELLLRLINDVLDLSRIESGNMEMINKQFNLENMFDDICKSFVNQMPNKNVELICETPKIDCFINADKGRLTQVVTNFINNAKKFTDNGYIKIGYNTVHNGVRMFVTDTGQGISKDKQEKIFDRFEKIDPFIQGTGLGLSICKAIILMHRGKIGVDSEPGKGSTFWAWIPIKYEIAPKDEIKSLT